MSKEIGKKDKNLTILIGKFEDATVFCGDSIFTPQIDPDDFLKPIHEIKSGNHVYRFINADTLSSSSLDNLKEDPNSVYFSGDLTWLLFNISKKGIKAKDLDTSDLDI